MSHRTTVAQVHQQLQAKSGFTGLPVCPPATPTDQTGLSSYTIQRRKRFWEVRTPSGELVCLTVYKRGAKAVIRHLETRNGFEPDPRTRSVL